MSITITLQAPSDAVMTDNNLWFGTDLADDDLRKVYGLPNMYIDDTCRKKHNLRIVLLKTTFFKFPLILLGI